MPTPGLRPSASGLPSHSSRKSQVSSCISHRSAPQSSRTAPAGKPSSCRKRSAPRKSGSKKS